MSNAALAGAAGSLCRHARRNPPLPSLAASATHALSAPCRWLAPEVLQGSPHSFASDTYSFGLVLWELLTWRPPFEGTTNPWQVGGAPGAAAPH